MDNYSNLLAPQEPNTEQVGLTDEQIIQQINEIGNKIVSVANNIATIHKEIHQMDLQFEAYIASLNNDIEKRKLNIPVVSKQLDSLNSMMSRILDKVLDMDVTTPMEMEHKMRMMEIIDKYLNQISNLTMRLLL
ncbi:MAG: hypothetical protein IJW88_08295 [Alistipes sp.]|nr:hypothetical protein [Alistipes sp.]